ncbi:hypothetical protein GCM10009547_03380 [Sporichthya brevicatena]|uniref:GtrA/DPMS transmembrane domain-containing protein n=1 Tax=Sporichthya brevicatena TaxID=171442 RepID=A0ABN1G649_9ACTN
MNSARGLARSLYARVEHLLHEIAKFGIVGAIAFVVDVGTFNLLRNGVMDDKPLTAKIVSTVLATTVAFAGNRQWTFKHRERSNLHREYVLFFGLNGVALLIALACLGVSHYLLNFTSPLADNISANIVGMALGTLFRFWSYRKFVFTAPVTRDTPADEPEPLAA